MSDTSNLSLNRDQLKLIAGTNDQNVIRTLELLLGLGGDVGTNSLNIVQINALLQPMTITPITPLTSQMSGNTTYTIPDTSQGVRLVIIPSALLVASSGGPWTLTITTGSGTSILVPISAAGDIIDNGMDLIFDLYIDASKNLSSKGWSISAHNALGYYIQAYNGDLTQYGESASIATGASLAITTPRPHSDTSFRILNTLVVASVGSSFGVSNGGPTSTSGFTLYSNNALAGPQMW